MKRTYLSCTLSGVLASIAVAAPAWAQDTAPAQQEEASEGYGEIVVTAQKREERLQDVPVTVSVVSGDELTRLNVTDIVSLQRAVPSLQLVGGGSGALQIRGVGTIGYSSTSEPSVALVVDGVVMPRMAGGLFSAGGLFDIERVEVLSGPQGTLFGKNASAGVVNIVTTTPRFGKLEGRVHFERGERRYGLAQAVINLPIGGNAALRISGSLSENGNIVHNQFRGASHDWSRGLRARLRWEPSDALRINIGADYLHASGNGVLGVVGPIRQVGAGTLLDQRLRACGIVAGPDNNRQCSNSQGPEGGFFTPNDSIGGSLMVAWDIGTHTLTSITANRWYNYGRHLPSGTPVNDGDNTTENFIASNIIFGRTSTFSQELRLASPAGQTLEYVLGAYYSDFSGHYIGDITGTLGVALPPGQFYNRYADIHTDSTSRALFANLTFNAGPVFRLIAGARFTDETLKEKLVPGAAPGFLLNPGFQLRALDNRVDTGNFSWRLGAQYDLTPDVMVFAMAARGYKGPQFNELTPTSIAPELVRKEIPTNFELGVKASLFDRSMLLNVSLFHQKVDGFQTNVFVPSANSGTITTFATGNAPYVLTRGVDVTMMAKPARGLELTANILYDKATYSPNFIVSCKQGSVAGCLTTSVRNVVFTPEWKMRLSADYSTPVGNGLEVFTGGDLNYTSRFNYSSTPDPNLRAPARTILGARLGVRAENDRWSAYVFGRNLTDERVPAMIAADSSGATNGGAGQSYTHNLSLDSYRVLGVALDFRF